jgi:hypothetical protein
MRRGGNRRRAEGRPIATCLPVGQELGRGGCEPVQGVVGDPVALAAQLAGERFLAEPAAILSLLGEDAGGSCDEAGIKARLTRDALLMGVFRASPARRAGCRDFGSARKCGVP